MLYTLPTGAVGEKHLQSRKTYYFRCCFWSSLKRPAKKVVANVAGQSLELLKRRQAHLRKPKGQPQRSIFGLNVFQRRGARHKAREIMRHLGGDTKLLSIWNPTTYRTRVILA